MTITVYEGKEKHEIPFEEGNTVLDVLQQGDHIGQISPSASQLHAVEKEPAKNALFLSSVMILAEHVWRVWWLQKIR